MAVPSCSFTVARKRPSAWHSATKSRAGPVPWICSSRLPSNFSDEASKSPAAVSSPRRSRTVGGTSRSP